MGDFENGIKGFVKGEYTVTVNFPIDWKDREEIACKHCPYLSSNERMCQLNKQPVHFPNHYVGYNCPLEFKEKNIFEKEKTNDKD